MGVIKGSICKCGQIHIPPEKTCIACANQIVTDHIELSDSGKLISYTTLNIVPDGFEAPLILAIVELDYFESNNENKNKGPKLICQGKPDEFTESDLRIGLSVAVNEVDGLYIFRKIG